MKKILSLLLVVAMVLSLAACGGTEEGELAKELHVYNWAEYWSPDCIAAFEEEYGVDVIESNFSSLEELLAKVMNDGGQYDVATAGDYMLDIMRKQELLLPINYDNIPNAVNVLPEYQGKFFDPDDEYSIPFNSGQVLVTFDDNQWDAEDFTNLEDLWDPRFEGQLVVLDDQRILIGTALLVLGYDPNTQVESELEEAKDKLIELLPNIKAFTSSNQRALLANGEASICYGWSGDALKATLEIEDVGYAYPIGGTHMYQDNYIIPVTCQEQYTAEVFINFMMSAEQAVKSLEWNPGGTIPYTDARELAGDEIVGNEISFAPSFAVAQAFLLADVGDATIIYDRIWTEFKQVAGQ